MRIIAYPRYAYEPCKKLVEINLHDDRRRLTVFENPFSLDSDPDIGSEGEDNGGNGQTHRHT